MKEEASFSMSAAIMAFACAFGLVVSPAAAETVTHIIPRKGEYAAIDVDLMNKTIQILGKGSSEERQEAIGKITASPENYAPPVFYLLSNILFQDGKKDEGAFYFYAGQLRARFDANRCADMSAREAVDVLNGMFGPMINKYTFQDVSRLEEIIVKVVEWDRTTPHHYDHRWINLHGLNAVRTALDTDDPNAKSTALSLPKEQWDGIAEQTRADYLTGFKKAIAEWKNQTKNPR